VAFGGLCLLKHCGVINPAWLLYVRLSLFLPEDLVVPVQMWAYALFLLLVPGLWHHLSGCHTPIFQPISFHCRTLSRCLTFVSLKRKGNHFLHCWALLWHIILGQTLSHSKREKGIKSNSLQLDMRGNQSVYDTARLCRKANIKKGDLQLFLNHWHCLWQSFHCTVAPKYLDAYATLNAFAVDNMIP